MEAKALAYSDMLHYVGDPHTDDIPTKKLISKELAKERARGITEKANCKVLPSDRKEQLDKLQSDTTYLATVDRDGMVVSFIQSNAGAFGAGLVPEHTGFVLQNRGGGFYMEPGQPNSLAGHKRPLHTIIPAMMQKDSQTIGFGIMSGFNQAQAHAQFVANVVDFDMNIQAALDAARFNKGNSGCAVNLEDGYPREVLEQLASQGHQINLVPRYSQVMGRGRHARRHFRRKLRRLRSPSRWTGHSRTTALLTANPNDRIRLSAMRDHLLRRLGGAGTILTVQPLRDGTGDFICLLRNLSQAVCDCQLKSGIGIVPVNQPFLSEAELQIESPMAFIELKNHPCMLNFFIEQGNRVQAYKAVDEIRCHHLRRRLSLAPAFKQEHGILRDLCGREVSKLKGAVHTQGAGCCGRFCINRHSFSAKQAASIADVQLQFAQLVLSIAHDVAKLVAAEFICLNRIIDGPLCEPCHPQQMRA
jgi:hypothetical protein